MGQAGFSAEEWELKSVTCTFEADTLQPFVEDAGNQLHDSRSS